METQIGTHDISVTEAVSRTFNSTRILAWGLEQYSLTLAKHAGCKVLIIFLPFFDLLFRLAYW